jgi:NADPH:quinone reductase-like Zn-dependent oxidoreductase
VVAASWPGHQHQPPAGGRPFGTFQQYLPVPEGDLLAVPEQLDDETAAQLFVSFVAAVSCRRCRAAGSAFGGFIQWHTLQGGSMLDRWCISAGKD